MSILEQLECAIFIGFFLGLMLVIPLTTFFLFVLGSQWAVPFFLVMVAFGYSPMYQPWPPKGAHSRLFELIVRYFSLQAILEASPPLREDGTYMFISAPHGVFPFANMLTLPLITHLTGKTCHGLAAYALVHAPVLRHLVALIGCIDASYPIAKAALDQGKSLGIIVGGIAEIFESQNDDEVAVIKERKGFVKLALQTGSQLVPCYCFGQTDVLSCIIDPWGILQWISRRIKFSFTYPFGRFFLPIPRRVPLLLVVGTPISIPKIAKPSQEDIDHYHQLFVEQLICLFDRHKAAYGWSTKRLLIK